MARVERKKSQVIIEYLLMFLVFAAAFWFVWSRGNINDIFRRIQDRTISLMDK